MNYELAKGELNKIFGDGFADMHPELVIEILKIHAIENLKTSMEDEIKETRLQITKALDKLYDK